MQFVYVLYEVIFAVSPFSRYFTVTIEEENEKSSTIFLFWQVILVGITSNGGVKFALVNSGTFHLVLYGLFLYGSCADGFMQNHDLSWFHDSKGL